MTENNVVYEAEIVPADDVSVIEKSEKEKAKEAKKLDKQIRTKVKAIGQNVYELGELLATMSNNKLYKSLGYDNFQSYCENAVGIARRSAYNYIDVYNMGSEFCAKYAQIGVSKLILLTMLDSEQREQFVADNDLENTFYKDLQSKVKAIKSAPITDRTQTTFDDVSDSDEAVISDTDDDIIDVSDNGYNDTDSDIYDEDETDIEGDDNKYDVETVSIAITLGNRNFTINSTHDFNDIVDVINSALKKLDGIEQ